MLYALTDDDLIIGTASGVGAGPRVPSAIAELPLDRLRLIDGEVVDCADRTDWHIDDRGRKRVAPADDRQPLTCAWDAALVRDGDAWRVRTEADVQAAELDELTRYLADRRWQAETAGTAWNGWVLPTDDRSQGKYLAELKAIDLGVRVDGELWKFPHDFEPISNDQVRQMAIAARNHVLACFALEAELAAGIAAGTITTTDQIDAAFAALEPTQGD